MAIALPGWGWQAADGIYHICVGPARTCRIAGLGTLGDLLSEQQAYFLRPNLLRVRSGCAHAYIANEPLLAWLASTPPMSPEAPMWHWIGQSIDAAMSSLPEMYAMFPMIAVQRTRFHDQRQQGIFLDVARYFFIYGVGARFAEAVAIVFSPVHWLTLEWARRRVNGPTPRTAADGST